MREPDLQRDGWCLDNGEAYHATAPATFRIPDLNRRLGLQPCDFAKLIFRIGIDNPEEPVEVERMWVLVRERTTDGYLGVLDNEPKSIGKNDEFWRGTELPFSPQHIVDIQDRNATSVSQTSEEPRRQWGTD